MTVAALTILAPLAAVVAILLLRRAAPALALLGIGVGLVAAVVTLIRVAGGARFSATLPGLPDLPLRLVVEPLTAILAVIVAVVSSLVTVYAVGYMEEEGGKVRFFAQMSFFAAAMQTLVIAGDWVLLLATWELIGLSSYLLIGFYYGRPGIPSAATRAFLYTRSADLGLYAAIFVLVSRTGTSEISQTFAVGGAAALAAGLLVLLAAAGKSAQTPFYGWLQDAMVGPTPVSALLHSATLVAAGAILLIRISRLLPEEVLLVIGILGGLTAVVTGAIAVAERDLKRLLAASTSSQYGFMLLAVGAGSPVAALFHLITHAAMKSSLFLGSGIFQHARGSTGFDDLRGLGRERPLAFAGFAMAGLALAAVPPLSGFFSKDAVLAATYESPYGFVLFPLALAGTILTGVYVARTLRLLWRGEGRGESVSGTVWMGVGMAGLVLLAAGLGIAKEPLGALIGEKVPSDLLTTVVGAAAALAGLLLGWFVSADRLLGPLRTPAGRGFRFAGGFYGLVARPAFALARAADAFDRGLYAGVLGVGRAGLAVASVARLSDERGIDRLVFGLARGMRALGGRARRLQTGLVHKELALAAAGAALIFVYLAITAIIP